MIKTREDLKEKYDSQYSDETEEWRRIGAIGKVENILELAEGLKIDSLIDVGAGDGNILSLLSKRKFCSNMSAAEISGSAIEQIKKKNIDGLKEIRQFDGYTLPFADKQFDLAICSHVIEHVEYPRMLLNEIKRISHHQILEVPIDFSFGVDKKFKHFNAYGHINIYTPALFNFLLLSQGFEILKSRSGLYRKEVEKFQYRESPIKYFKILIKRIIWKSVPLLMKVKPNTYTVLTR
ncbi:MAG: class I SAM-dependent methyltransferase [Bacteroidales bacterium]|nr:class I SAM-dependent methyltransferase [Bacteroidales bacterium]